MVSKVTAEFPPLDDSSSQEETPEETNQRLFRILLNKEEEISRLNAELAELKRRNLIQSMKAQVVDEISTAILLTDATGTIFYANTAAYVMFGEIQNTNILESIMRKMEPRVKRSSSSGSVVQEMPTFGDPVFSKLLWAQLRSDPDCVIDEAVRVWSPVQEAVINAYLGAKCMFDKENNQPWFLIEFKDVKKQLIDELTGLFRREVAVNVLERETGHRNGMRSDDRATPISVILMDIDNFKHFNTAYGYDGGNKILRVVAEIIRSNVRNKDVACRWFSGDEFLIVIYGNVAVAVDVAQRICDAVSKHRTTMKHPVTKRNIAVGLSMSLGVAEYMPGMDWNELTKVAEQQLVISKDGGKGRVSASFKAVTPP